MKYKKGTIVVLQNGETVYITDYNKKKDEYKGYDTEMSGLQKEVVFSESEIVMKV